MPAPKHHTAYSVPDEAKYVLFNVRPSNAEAEHFPDLQIIMFLFLQASVFLQAAKIGLVRDPPPPILAA